MRIVGGDRRGTAIVAPKGDATRPTTDRMRETIFNIVAHRYGDRLVEGRVLDLFAGSGAMGLEALSRGAAFALFVENATGARGALRTNIDALGAAGRTRVWKRDATRLGTATLPPFSLVFCDPPYAQGLGAVALTGAASGGWLTADGIAVLEEKRGALPEEVPGLTRLDVREVGDSAVGFFALDAA
ncbi:16S rRNA (guanine(966)-N(2))-methyltransferase RsmD [Acuticoccus sp. MNP-M23]|uniref:16S rRNA (guanine(966)-N(2))-methyltransferase RsmD n=1 Tax=Acuticoccus sp. MNP-M23 TaxID=3072793 RepID=UPI0028152E85|nr:16S rRNA (guanine(966)-N(2))-methyltransferase RsmD [Acuticoccus sp. MNP-M23]WMS41093.1 16S rRNA (guanine(966)-N(2))-methyltransferase RsmD [Acuticoccus sp. MNP-M23]